MAGVANAPNILTLARAAVGEISHKIGQSSFDRALFCLEMCDHRNQGGKLGQFIDNVVSLTTDERHYWIGTFYTLLLTLEQRRSQAAYFTPPYLAEAVIDLALEAGLNLAKHDVLDPAAGGAAFLSTIAARMQRVGLEAEDIVYRLNGIEIDPGLAQISETLIHRRIGSSEKSTSPARKMIAVGDALATKPLAAYNMVVANPPYGRMAESELFDDAWQTIARRGHVNKYALFTEYCLRFTKPGGITALVIPSSFRAGPLYDKMRSYICSQGQILVLGHVNGRDDVFVDVAQDVSVLLIRKGTSHKTKVAVVFPNIEPGGEAKQAIRRTLPADKSRPWPTPEADDGVRGGAVLSDYGAVARSGYFVWNREKKRMRSDEEASTFPLIWAKNVKAGVDCRPVSKSGNGIDFIVIDPASQAVIRGPAMVMQRTTNNKQPRRLIASMVHKSVHMRWKGFVTENHTIVITGDDRDQLRLLEQLLNTKAVDRRYRRVAGTASISVTLLRELDLPAPARFELALAISGGDAEIAAERAYDITITLEPELA
jgi:adenine-specific DNA-methyltransferase